MILWLRTLKAWLTWKLKTIRWAIEDLFVCGK